MGQHHPLPRNELLLLPHKAIMFLQTFFLISQLFNVEESLYEVYTGKSLYEAAK